MRRALIADAAPLSSLLAAEGWYLDLAPLRYLSHFITPPSSPIRFTARFFLAPVPAGQDARLFDEEASEGFWIDPPRAICAIGEGEMPMAEPADCGLGYLAGFDSVDALWAAHADGRHKFHGIDDRVPYRAKDTTGQDRPWTTRPPPSSRSRSPRGWANETALVTPDRRVTYAELPALVDRAAHALRALGVEPEQRVALLLPDGIGFAATFFAAIKIGAVAVPLNTRLAAAALRAMLSDCRPRSSSPMRTSWAPTPAASRSSRSAR